MALPIYFFFKANETGGTGSGTLQYLNGETWTNIGNWNADSGYIVINSHKNVVEIDYGIFTPGGTFQFRLIDSAGHPISNVVSITFPESDEALLNVDNSPLLNVDGTPLLNL